MRAAIILLFAACGSSVAPTSAPAPAAPIPDLTLEVTPTSLGVHPPGELPPLTVAIINHSTTRTYVLPLPHRLAHEGPATIYYEYERARADGTWEPPSRAMFLNHSRYQEDPHATFELPPGGRVVLDSQGIPPLTFADDVIGKMRVRLVYDIDAEWKRRKQAAPHVPTVRSDLLELDQIAGPLEVKLEVIGPIVIGTALDLPRVLRVTVRNRSAKDITIFGPGEYSGMGFDIDTPNGGVWPKGDRPVMGVADGAGRTAVLHPGEIIEAFGPHPALGLNNPGTWSYPVVESFRLRANFYQPTTQRFHYSDWVSMQAVAQ